MRTRSLILLVATALLAGPAALAGEKPGNAAGADLVGTWEMNTDFQGQQIPAVMKISMVNGELSGVWESMGQEMPLTDLEVRGKTVRFKRAMGAGGQLLQFEGKLKKDTLTGTYESSAGRTMACTGKRTG